MGIKAWTSGRNRHRTLIEQYSDDLRRDDHATKLSGMFEKLEAWESNFVVTLIFPLD